MKVLYHIHLSLIYKMITIITDYLLLWNLYQFLYWKIQRLQRNSWRSSSYEEFPFTYWSSQILLGLTSLVLFFHTHPYLPRISKTQAEEIAQVAGNRQAMIQPQSELVVFIKLCFNRLSFWNSSFPNPIHRLQLLIQGVSTVVSLSQLMPNPQNAF